MKAVQEAILPVLEKLEKLPRVKAILPEKRRTRIEWVGILATYDHGTRERVRAAHWASKYWFNIGIMVLAGLSAFMLGYEIDNSPGVPLKDRMGYFLADFLFTCAFLGEMFVRQHQQGWDYFLDVWNMFDYALVVMNLSDLLISIGAEDGGFQLAACLRTARLLRIAKQVEGIQMLRSMWLVLQGLANSLKTMVWTGLLMVIIVYTLSIVSLTFISDNMDETRDNWPTADMYVGNLYRSIITTVQVFTLDAWATDVARPLLDSGNLAVIIILIVTIVLCNFGVLNIVIALMVERISVMQKTAEERNQRILTSAEDKLIRMILKDFGQVAQKMDDGHMEYQDFKDCVTRPDVERKFKLLGYPPDEVDSMFELFDVMKIGAISMHDFCEGLSRMRGLARGLDIVALISFAHRQERIAKDCLKKTRLMSMRADRMQERLDWMGQVVHKELRYSSKLERRAMQVLRVAHKRNDMVKSWEEAQATFYPVTEEMAEFADSEPESPSRDGLLQ